ncbi:outer membrane beta-barrel protein [Echinicola jeungdonensis]|uniref:outer membrane beta-barrel protein n=1 Tax=Echinicola jeungdonensis TaxID=709343 RepID=UPI0025B2B452|nr:outer membrane beta-barrel protein [Echinicola jeungdonensis]MDN3668082.1 outer membrane beta-barrel protein [Echinicola jeungdonensis]
MFSFSQDSLQEKSDITKIPVQQSQSQFLDSIDNSANKYSDSEKEENYGKDNFSRMEEDPSVPEIKPGSKLKSEGLDINVKNSGGEKGSQFHPGLNSSYQKKDGLPISNLSFGLKQKPEEWENPHFDFKLEEISSMDLVGEMGTPNGSTKSQKIEFSNWYYGLGISWSTSWINDPRFRRAKEEGTLTQVSEKGAFSGQVHGGYRFNNFWSIYGGVDFLGTSQQQFGEYINGDYVKGGTNINYWGCFISLRRKYNPKSIADWGIEKAFFIGPYVSKIESVEQELLTYLEGARTREQQTQMYKPFEWGGVLGYEMIYPLNEKYQLGFQLSYRVGFNNIYQGNEQIPSYLRRTTTSEFLINMFIRKK